jgi:hypothetical protein
VSKGRAKHGLEFLVTGYRKIGGHLSVLFPIVLGYILRVELRCRFGEKEWQGKRESMVFGSLKGGDDVGLEITQVELGCLEETVLPLLLFLLQNVEEQELNTSVPSGSSFVVIAELVYSHGVSTGE